MNPNATRGVRAVPIALIGLAAVAYAMTCARSVLGGDNGELATLGAVGGVAHPPGYPVFVLLLRAFSFLPAASPAHRAALITALVGVATLVALFSACRAYGASVAGASMALAVFAFGTRAWIASTHAEVFALNAFFAATIVAVSLSSSVRGIVRVASLGLLAGLALGNHHTSVLLAPIGLYGAIRGVREHRSSGSAVAAGVAALVVGLLPYAYVVVCTRHPAGHVVWGEATDLGGLVRHFRRAEYGTGTLVLHRVGVGPLRQITALCFHVVVDLLCLPLLALAVAIVGRLRPSARPTPPPERVPTVLVAVTLGLAGPAFVSLFNLGVEGLDRQVVERFWLLPELLTCVLLSPWLLPAPFPAHRVRIVAPVVAILVVVAAVRSAPEVVAHHHPSVERYARNVLAVAPKDAVLLGTGDHRFGAFLYAREALGLRRDVVYVDVMLLHHAWYRRQASRAVGVELMGPDAGSLATPAIAAQILATGRPVFLTDSFTRAIEATYPTYPVGPLVRVLAKGSATPAPGEVEQENLAAFGVMALDASPPAEGTWGGDLHRAYARPWRALEGAYRRSGDAEGAARCAARAVAIDATSPRTSSDPS